MDIILWRHAEAEDNTPDMQRALTAKGQKQAKNMAAWLAKRLPAELRILVSPALRTQQTASALTAEFITVQSIAPGASALAILDAAGWPHADGGVLIVGHQPTLGEVAAYLLGNPEQYLNIKKGAVWWFQNRKRGNVSETLLKVVLNPELL
jgi:phosphohistidine phosphatase